MERNVNSFVTFCLIEPMKWRQFILRPHREYGKIIGFKMDET